MNQNKKNWSTTGRSLEPGVRRILDRSSLLYADAGLSGGKKDDPKNNNSSGDESKSTSKQNDTTSMSSTNHQHKSVNNAPPILGPAYFKCSVSKPPIAGLCGSFDNEFFSRKMLDETKAKREEGTKRVTLLKEGFLKKKLRAFQADWKEIEPLPALKQIAKDQMF